MFWLLFLGIIFVVSYFFIYKPTQYWKERGVKHLKPLPLIGNLSPFILGKTSFFDFIKNLYYDIDGRYCGIHQFTQPILIVKDPELVKQITIKDFEHFVDHKSFFSESEEPIFSENLFSRKGQDWRDLRSTLSPAFTGSKMRAMFILISECAERFANHFHETIKRDNLPQIEANLKQVYTRFTVDVIGTCAYGVECDSLKDKNNDFYEIGKTVGDFSGIKAVKSLGFMICPEIMRFFKIRFFNDDQLNFFKSLVTKTIDFREKNKIVRPDLIHLMMEARKGKLKYEESADIDDTGFATVAESDWGKKGKNLDVTDNLIVAQAMVFFLGGTETTSTFLSLISTELAINPDIQRKLQNEIDRVWQETNGKITYEVLSQMKYLDMVVSETLRKWPPGYFIDRHCVKDFTVQPTNPNEEEFIIKKGEIVWIPVVGLHNDPKYFKDPERFDPERFNDENKSNISSSVYIPFGLGPRSCIGNRFALLVAKTFLYHFLHKFDLTCVKKTKVPIQLSKSQLIINSANGFWLGFKPREK